MAHNFWKKHQTQIFLDTTPSGTSPTWARLGLSTVLSIDVNPETEDYDFIEDENPSTVVLNNHPSMEQELMAQEGDSCFDFVWELFYGLGSGSEVETTMLIAFPKIHTAGSSSTPDAFKAWKQGVTVVLNNFDAVAKKISFTLQGVGDVTAGKITVTDGTPTFVAD